MSETTITYDITVDQYIYRDAKGNELQRVPRSAFGRDRSHLLGADKVDARRTDAIEIAILMETIGSLRKEVARQSETMALQKQRLDDRHNQVLALTRENGQLHGFIKDLNEANADLHKQVREFKPQIDSMVGEILDLQCKLLMSAASDLRDAAYTDPPDGTPPALIGFAPRHRGGLVEG